MLQVLCILLKKVPITVGQQVSEDDGIQLLSEMLYQQE